MAPSLRRNVGSFSDFSLSAKSSTVAADVREPVTGDTFPDLDRVIKDERQAAGRGVQLARGFLVRPDGDVGRAVVGP